MEEYLPILRQTFTLAYSFVVFFDRLLTFDLISVVDVALVAELQA